MKATNRKRVARLILPACEGIFHDLNQGMVGDCTIEELRERTADIEAIEETIAELKTC